MRVIVTKTVNSLKLFVIIRVASIYLTHRIPFDFSNSATDFLLSIQEKMFLKNIHFFAAIQFKQDFIGFFCRKSKDFIGFE